MSLAESKPAEPLTTSTADDAITVFSDSGYGGSEGVPEVEKEILRGSEGGDGQERNHLASLQQLHYNQSRVALGRSINRTIETLKDFQRMNAKWPAHYPSVQRLNGSQSLQRTQTSAGTDEIRPSLPRRAATTLEDAQTPQASQEPRLVTPQIAQEFNVLKLDLKLGALSQTELVHSLEKNSIASLLDGKLSQSIKHLQALRERIDDTSSKVLVTGDLNAGKSTFCNALLRKKVLPEDQQPCTSIFCEVLDARENRGIEEVHAMRRDMKYDRSDDSTYDVYTLAQLEDLVVENDKYAQVKIYVEDIRRVDESLLNNGVVDIALIDAPGLNLDSIKTTAVFARQEEIDVVVFVVSAENHFTLSAKEFIWNAANEKAYIFIVVNRFDNIRDKARCKRMILDQVAALSPRTRQDADELVHFVSSNCVLNGEDKAKIEDFNKLETSLRSFVLEKRARSKLAPAKTYLLNLLQDLQTMGTVNKEVTESELERVRALLEELTPQFEAAVKARAEVSEEVQKTIEENCAAVYKSTRTSLNSTLEHMDDIPIVPYHGILNAYAYAEETRQALLKTIQTSVALCEEAARSRTVNGVAAINALGLLHLSSEFVEKAFRPEVMFTRKRDALSRQIDTQIDLLDFFDFDRQEKVAGLSMSLTLATAVGGQIFGIGSWIDAVWKATNILGPRTARKLLVPALIIAAGAGAVFLAQDIPKAVPKKLSKKIRRQLEEIDYVHINADRITREVRKVLQYPAEELRGSFQRTVEKRGKEREELKKSIAESEVARKWFGNLCRDVQGLQKGVETIDLEAVVKT